MRCFLTLLMLLTVSFAAPAQDAPALSIGEKGNQFPITNPPESERMTTAAFRADPKLYINGGKNEYLITRYEVSVLVNDKNVIGPFTIGENNAQEVFDKLYPHFEMGAKVFYDKIMLVCRDCVPPAPIAAKGRAVVLE